MVTLISKIAFKITKRNYVKVIVLHFFMLFCFLGHSQGIPPPLGSDSNWDAHSVLITIPEVALLDLESNTGTVVTLNPSVPTDAGSSLIFPVIDNSIWLNYSSLVGSVTEPSRNITVQISSGTVPSGTNLKIVAGLDSGNGDGMMGVPVGSLLLSNEAQNIISNIGSSYTGNGVNKGHNLEYMLDLLPDTGAYGLLDFDYNDILIVTFTLTDF